MYTVDHVVGHRKHWNILNITRFDVHQPCPAYMENRFTNKMPLILRTFVPYY